MPTPPKGPSEALAAVYEQLKKVRASKTVSLKPIPRLKDTIIGFDGLPQPFKLRYYQVQGAYHLMLMKRMVLGDGTGLGKTCEAITALSYLWEKETANKVIVVAPKSALRQWAKEITRFTNGVKPMVVSGSLTERKVIYEKFKSAPTGPKDPKVVLILNYAILIRDWNAEGFQPTLPNGRIDPKKPVVPGVLDQVTRDIGDKNLVTIYDECTAFKSMSTKTWETCRFLSDRSHRCYGLTATLLKNHLMEGYCIYKAIKPDLFSTKTKFYDDYCYVELKRVGKARIPIILGYKNLDQFRLRIDPFFLGRPKHAVSDELPTLTTREVSFEMSRAEEIKYQEALDGVLALGDGSVRDFEEHKALVSLNYCQQVVNSLALLKFKEGDEILDRDVFEDESHKLGKLGSKEQALADLLSDELDGEKVIVYTRYESVVSRLQAILDDRKIKSVRITGKESDKVRQKSQEAFQDMTSDTSVIFITDAGSEAINLQAAAAMVFFDMPWSWGNYVQILGRMIRIGSPHPSVVAYHLLAERPDRSDSQTIDHHVLKLLRKKKNLIDKVLGEAAVGALKFEKESGSLRELVQSLQGKSV